MEEEEEEGDGVMSHQILLLPSSLPFFYISNLSPHAFLYILFLSLLTPSFLTSCSLSKPTFSRLYPSLLLFFISNPSPLASLLRYGWQTKGDVIASKGGPCAAFLMYTVKLVKPGAVTYVYQYTDEDIIFEFEAQDEECQIITEREGAKWPPLTPEGQWKKRTLELDPGVYVLHWKTIGIEVHGPSRPVLIKSVPWEESSIKPRGSLRLFETDVAKIFNINVSNTVEGGASSCLPCFQSHLSLTLSPQQAQAAAGCIPCPVGHYIEKNSTECTPCPPNTVVTDALPYGPESCLPCGPGLVAPDHLSCGAQCHLRVISRVCRFTLVPGVEGVIEGGHTGKLATQSVSLGDHLIGYSTNTTLMNISVIDEFINPHPAVSPDLHFFYTAPQSTRACPNGRATTLTLRCDPEQPGSGKVVLPTQCPDGTCDGCNFHFLWSSAYACRQCAPEDLTTVHGECVKGFQKVHYITPSHCRHEHSKEGRLVPCSVRLSFLVEVIVLSAVGVALLPCLLLFCLWKKNQRLEYKYMKLVAKESSKSREIYLVVIERYTYMTLYLAHHHQHHHHHQDGMMELPPAESCALDDGEEEEVQFSKQPPRGLLGKFKQHKIVVSGN
ncbi:UPF0577 protein KIAA1324-like [Portunus trituberculatus]|uniref:UPF0577 protein KIAA1324-like n=1 Tax=Portunus trituberculatus TaxID=210409 RepID=A0A5B7DVW5_PORTR|nr:UPF0577 protein KIAA1324-like [Portunus trituberculatus]